MKNRSSPPLLATLRGLRVAPGNPPPSFLLSCTRSFYPNQREVLCHSLPPTGQSGQRAELAGCAGQAGPLPWQVSKVCIRPLLGDVFSFLRIHFFTLKKDFKNLKKLQRRVQNKLKNLKKDLKKVEEPQKDVERSEERKIGLKTCKKSSRIGWMQAYDKKK